MHPEFVRNQVFERWPFGSLTEFADFAEEVDGLVREAAGGSEVLLLCDLDDRKYTFRILDDLRQTLADVPLADLKHLSWTISFGGSHSLAINGSLGRTGTKTGLLADLHVQGRNRTDVEGVFAQLLRQMEGGVKRAEGSSRQETESELPEVPSASNTTSPAPPRPSDTFKGFLYNPWTISIGSTLVVGVALTVLFGR